MPEFSEGFRPGETFYEGAARPPLETHFPALPHTAAVPGRSSEVLGIDEEGSRDHKRLRRLPCAAAVGDNARPLLQSILSSAGR